MADSPGWLEGAILGFASAFAIQAFAGHWKLWVDGRKSIIDDLVKAIDAARTASVEYFEQETIQAGSSNPNAREVIYSQRLVTDLFGIVDNQFGPVSDVVASSFRLYRERSTGEGFLKAGVRDSRRAADIAIAAANCSSTLREWGYAQLSPVATTSSWCRRKWRNLNRRRRASYSQEDIARLTR